MSERLNVKGMLVEAEKPTEYRFNPLKEITPEQQVKIAELFNQHAEKGQWSNFLFYASQAKLLGLKIDIQPKQESSLKKIIFADLGSDTEGALSMVAKGKIVGIDMGPNQFSLSDVNGAMDEVAQLGYWDPFAVLAFNARICGLPISISAEQARNIEKVTQGHFRTGELFGAVELLAYQRVLGLPINITNEQRVLLAQQRDEFAESEGYSYNFVEFAANEAIISADKVVIPPAGGLELEFKDMAQYADSTPTLPEPRKF